MVNIFISPSPHVQSPFLQLLTSTYADSCLVQISFHRGHHLFIWIEFDFAFLYLNPVPKPINVPISDTTSWITSILISSTPILHTLVPFAILRIFYEQFSTCQNLYRQSQPVLLYLFWKFWFFLKHSLQYRIMMTDK